MTAVSEIEVRPVTPERWSDFAALFEARGSPHYCWCTVYRRESAAAIGKAAKRSLMQRLVGQGTPVGVLAYEDGEPVGWCSVAPRETYPRLARSRVMPRADDRATWTVLCFFLRRSHRQRGLTHTLLRGAVHYAREQGAEVIEGYPFDTAGISTRFRGHSSVFRNAGFRQDGSRWWLSLES
jgi:GNAT superfamily N-acetyltransferase